MKVLVTGADGFVGSSMVPRLLAEGYEVVAGVRPGGPSADVLRERFGAAIPIVPLELREQTSVSTAVDGSMEAVIHLAAIASGFEAGRDPGVAWEINAAGTARLAHALAAHAGEADPLLLLVSTAEVYGLGTGAPRRETDPPAPCSPYAASKLGAEVAALETHRRTGLRVVIARAFPHTGRGQDGRFVVPSLAHRVREAARVGARVVKVGNLAPVRELLHVSDIADAYCRLLRCGRPGEVYNVAGGQGWSLEDIFERLARLAGAIVRPEVDPALVRPADIPHLVGDGAKLRAATGWQPRHGLDETLAEVLGAQTD